MNKWKTIKEFQKETFVGKPPCAGTFRNWCKKGYIKAKKQYGRWLIDADAFLN